LFPYYILISKIGLKKTRYHPRCTLSFPETSDVTITSFYELKKGNTKMENLTSNVKKENRVPIKHFKGNFDLMEYAS